MKKVIALAAAMIMVMGMATSVFAANSPAVIESGADVGAGVTEKAIDANSAAAKALGTTEAEIEKNLPTVLEDLVEEDLTGAKFELLYAADISSADSVVVFTVTDSTLDGYEVYALHYGKNGWEVIPAKVVGNTVKVEFGDFSPVYLFAVKDAVTDKPVGLTPVVADDTEDDEKKSHKTGY